MEQNALTVVSDEVNLIADLTKPSVSQYCSLIPQNEDEELLLFNAMNNPSKRISDCINMDIVVKHVYCEMVTCVNKETGETSTCPRTVLISPNGESYQCVSFGIFNSMKKVFAVYGTPDCWKKPIKVRIEQVKRGTNSILTFKLVK